LRAWATTPWCVDCEGYGRSDKSRPVNADISGGADDLAAASGHHEGDQGDALGLHGESSGGLRAALHAQRHPRQDKRRRADEARAFVWTGGQRHLDRATQKLAQFRASNRGPIEPRLHDAQHRLPRSASGRTSDQEAIVETHHPMPLSRRGLLGAHRHLRRHVREPPGCRLELNARRSSCAASSMASSPSRIDTRFFAKLPTFPTSNSWSCRCPFEHTRSRNWAIVYHLLDAYFSQPALATAIS
jgi:hypothetical protein